MAVGYKGQRSENAACSGALSFSTMMVTITAKAASEYTASLSAVSFFSGIVLLQSGKPGSSCSIQIGKGLTDAPAGSVRNIYRGQGYRGYPERLS